ncbi:hypothetical protein CsSME_00003371 [Camellia sinensis var. sinensis]
MKSPSLKISGEATMTPAELYAVLLQLGSVLFTQACSSSREILRGTRCKSILFAQTGIFHHNHDPLIATYYIKDRW